jgi:hypothetical protein
LKFFLPSPSGPAKIKKVQKIDPMPAARHL